MISNGIKVSVIAKDKIVYNGEAVAVLVPTQSGVIEVLPGHIQLVSALKSGTLEVKTPEGEENKIFKIQGGVLEVRNGYNVIILVDIVPE